MRNLRKKRIRAAVSLFVMLLLVIFGSRAVYYKVMERKVQEAEAESIAEAEKETERDGEIVEKETPSEAVLEDKSIYDADDEFSVVTMYLTVREGNEEDNTNHTWTEVNQYSAYYYEENGLSRYNCDALLQVGDENGPLEGELGYGETAANAAVQIRGQTSSRREQKNYKIRIKEGKGEWRGQRTIALNKHRGSALRFTNKLAYDLMKEVPQMIGARTQFVHLYVKDETEGGNGQFTDYGLFVQVEQMNRTYLKSHGLDNRGHLYKVNFFEWNKYEEIVNSDDPEYDLGDFEYYLEVKGDDDHTKLLETIDKVNDYSIPIQEIVEQHFDAENICYWAAFQILIGNYDVGARNLFLYSPLNSEKWYFISWDNDASFTRTYYERINYSEGQSWEQGITKYTGVVLLRRMFQEEEYRRALDDAMNDLKENYLTKERVESLAAGYQEVVERYLFSEPDIQHARVDTVEEYRLLVDNVYSEILLNYSDYLESLEKPWPFFVGEPYVKDGKLHVNWDISYDVDGERITYHAILARDYHFTDIVEEKDGLRIPGTSFEDPGPGTYFLRVQAKNESGYVQDCFDYLSIGGIGKVYGTLAFSIDEKGKVTVGFTEE